MQSSGLCWYQLQWVYRVFFTTLCELPFKLLCDLDNRFSLYVFHGRTCTVNKTSLFLGPYTDVRLSDGPSVKAGRVEVWYNGTWLQVCADYNFDTDDAKVICRTLGYNQRYLWLNYLLISFQLYLMSPTLRNLILPLMNHRVLGKYHRRNTNFHL